MAHKIFFVFVAVCFDVVVAVLFRFSSNNSELHKAKETTKKFKTFNKVMRILMMIMLLLLMMMLRMMTMGTDAGDVMLLMMIAIGMT